MTFRFQLATPDKVFFNGDAESLVVPGPEGYFGILARHARMVAAVGTGILKIEAAGSPQLFVVDGGVAEVTPEETMILADVAIAASDSADAEEKLAEIRATRRTPVSIR